MWAQSYSCSQDKAVFSGEKTMKTAQAIDRYLSLHPFERDCLARGLINYSKLSRQICKNMNLKSFDAVLVACRRYAAKLEPKKDAAFLKNSKISAKVEKGNASVSVKLSKPVTRPLGIVGFDLFENR